MKNPIDRDKTAEEPGLLAYPHTIGSPLVNPADKGKIKHRALTAMQEQTNVQLRQIQGQVELLLRQANQIRERISISEKIYQADMSFEPFIGNTYHLYETNGAYKLMLIGPDEWGRSKGKELLFICSAKLLSDHTWELLS